MTNYTLLLVEDDADSRDGLCALLELSIAACRVVCAEDGVDALTQLRAGFQPQVILLDLHLPRMDGRAFRSQQLADPRLRQIPVILCSAGTDLEESAQAMGIRRDDVLRKPLDFERLFGRLEQYRTA